MRGADGYISTVRLEDFVPANPPLRPIRQWMTEALSQLAGKFAAKYEADVKSGRPSITPEKPVLKEQQAQAQAREQELQKAIKEVQDRVREFEEARKRGC
jgi:uncharacterized protein YlxW (UPF0749 family)